jgi:hypothetical protein
MVRKADVDSAEYVLTRMSVIKPRAPLTASQEIIMQTGVRCTAASTHKKKKRITTEHRNPPPARDTYPSTKEFYLSLRGIQQPQEYQEFNRLLNLLTARYKHCSNPRLADYKSLGKNKRQPLNRRLVGPKTGVGAVKERKCSTSARNQIPFLSCQAHDLVPIPIELFGCVPGFKLRQK